MGRSDDENEVETLRNLVQTFVREFGLLAADETPCGHPIPLSYAHALMILLKARGDVAAISQAQLGDALGIDKSNVARLCSRMEEAGHAEQRRAPDDGRSRLIELTEKGRS